MLNQILTVEEKKKLKNLLSSGYPTVMRVQGKGEKRHLSFRAEGAKLEVRIPYPDAN